ncbi:MAG: hypothetical protein Q8K32_09325 [Archangium sp.]|nr:hypothetical protein [Archangium sp.]
MVEFRRTTKLDTIRLGCWLRPADAAEVHALGLGSIEACFESWKRSQFATTMLVQGEVAACAGLVLEQVSALVPRRAQVWLLTSIVVDTAPMAFHRGMKQLLAGCAAHTDFLWQHVDARYESSLRWLARLGFVVHPPRPHGPHQLPFHLVTREF